VRCGRQGTFAVVWLSTYTVQYQNMRAELVSLLYPSLESVRASWTQSSEKKLAYLERRYNVEIEERCTELARSTGNWYADKSWRWSKRDGGGTHPEAPLRA
jgi:hypothetical protein